MCVCGGGYCQGWAHLVHREVTYRGALVLAHVPRVKVELLDSGPGFDPAGKGEEMAAARGGGGKERRLTSKQHVGQAKIEGESGARERERPHSLEWSQRRRIAGTNQSQHSHSTVTAQSQSQHSHSTVTARIGGSGRGSSTGARWFDGAAHGKRSASAHLDEYDTFCMRAYRSAFAASLVWMSPFSARIYIERASEQPGGGSPKNRHTTA